MQFLLLFIYIEDWLQFLAFNNVVLFTDDLVQESEAEETLRPPVL
jgi:hypothetical protein